MADFQTSRTNPHVEVDLLCRIRLLEWQITTIADAVRILADALDEGTTTKVAKQIEELLDTSRVPHLTDSEPAAGDEW